MLIRCVGFCISSKLLPSVSRFPSAICSAAYIAAAIRRQNTLARILQPTAKTTATVAHHSYTQRITNASIRMLNRLTDGSPPRTYTHITRCDTHTIIIADPHLRAELAARRGWRRATHDVPQHNPRFHKLFPVYIHEVHF